MPLRFSENHHLSDQQTAANTASQLDFTETSLLSKMVSDTGVQSAEQGCHCWCVLNDATCAGTVVLSVSKHTGTGTGMYADSWQPRQPKWPAAAAALPAEVSSNKNFLKKRQQRYSCSPQ
jgi:hypothetical protein